MADLRLVVLHSAGTEHPPALSAERAHAADTSTIPCAQQRCRRALILAIIGVDARALTTNAGRGRILKELLPAVIEQLEGDKLILYGSTGDVAPDLPPGRWSFSVPGRRAWHVATAARASRSADVLFSANTYISPLFATAPTAGLVCDLVSFHEFRAAHPRARINERITLPLAARRCQLMFCISQSTMDDLIARYPWVAPKARLMTLAASTAFFERPSGAEMAEVRRRYGLPPTFILAVGTIEPRKNIPRLIAAHNALPPPVRDRFPLALVGEAGWTPGPFQAAMATAAGDVRALGFVPDRDLNCLYRLAEAVCYPSLYEGFGLPVLEAMAAGAPVLTSDRSSLPEVAGGAALLVSPMDIDDIASGLLRLLEDEQLRTRLVQEGHRQAARYSWSSAARDLLAGLRTVVRREGGR